MNQWIRIVVFFLSLRSALARPFVRSFVSFSIVFRFYFEFDIVVGRVERRLCETVSGTWNRENPRLSRGKIANATKKDIRQTERKVGEFRAQSKWKEERCMCWECTLTHPASSKSHAHIHTRTLAHSRSSSSLSSPPSVGELKNSERAIFFRNIFAKFCNNKSGCSRLPISTRIRFLDPCACVCAIINWK